MVWLRGAHVPSSPKGPHVLSYHVAEAVTRTWCSQCVRVPQICFWMVLNSLGVCKWNTWSIRGCNPCRAREGGWSGAREGAVSIGHVALSFWPWVRGEHRRSWWSHIPKGWLKYRQLWRRWWGGTWFCHCPCTQIPSSLCFAVVCQKEVCLSHDTSYRAESEDNYKQLLGIFVPVSLASASDRQAHATAAVSPPDCLCSFFITLFLLFQCCLSSRSLGH